MLGKGGYGTVYRPFPIECARTKKLRPKKRYVGKMVNTSMISLQTVQRIQKLRQAIDKDQHFTVPFVGYCPKDLSNALHPAWGGTKYNMELIYPFAGREFIRTETKQRLLCGFYLLFRRIADMNQAGLYHLDIKAENILKKDNDGYVLIDFDLCVPHDRMTDYFLHRKTFMGVVYYIWPPELNFFVNSLHPWKPVQAIPSGLQSLTQTNTFSKTDVISHVNRFLHSADYANLLHGKQTWDPSTSDLYSVGILLRMHMWKFSPDLDQLIIRTIEPIPSRRIRWDEFLTIYRDIVVIHLQHE